MIDNISEKIAAFLQRKYPDDLPNFKSNRYSIKFLLTNLLTIFILVVYGWLTLNLIHIIEIMLSFAILRRYAGGVHIRNADMCVLVSIVMVISINLLSKSIGNSIFMNSVTVILVAGFAPSYIKKKINRNKHKLISLVIVMLGILLNEPHISLALFIEAVTLIYFKPIYFTKGGEKIEEIS